MARLILTALVLLLIPCHVLAANSASTSYFTARLVAESRTPAPGQDLTLALVIEPENGWHTYWKNPGETGLPPQPEWKLPPGFTAGKLQYPVPVESVIGGMTSNIYDGKVVLLTNLTVPKRLRPHAAIPAGLDLRLLICSDSRCVPQSVSLDLSLAAGDGAPDPGETGLFSEARSRLPASLDEPASYALRGGTLALSLPVPQAGNVVSAHVFFDGDGIVSGGRQKLTRHGQELSINMPQGAITGGAALHGVVRVVYSGRRHSGSSVSGYRFIARPHVISTSNPAEAALSAGFFLAFGGAILGGLLLNLMPCVFPILSIKALALARAGGDEREARVEALGYTLGAVTVLILLGAAVIALKSAGHAAGWAFQLQDTRVVAVLLLLVTAIATNLGGLYELPSFNPGVGHRDGFWGGIGAGSLAAFIATPCTGPFMAGALGAALLLPVPAALAVFAGLGLGLSLPFLCLGYIAPLRAWLPSPGAWMLTLRRLLSLPMFATALGLVWIVGREAGVPAMTFSLSASLLLGLALWWYGIRQFSGRSGLPILLPVAAAVAIAVTGVEVHPVNTPANRPAAHLLNSRPYSAALLTELQAEHKPVFVYLTADWCLSCKVNEATSLSSEAVAHAFSRAHVSVLEGDWTRADPEVTRLLAKEGRAGVPLYLWYSGEGPAEILPQVLTPAMLVKLARRADTDRHSS